MIRLFLAGTEGTGKTSCLEALVPQISQDWRVLTSDPESPALWSDAEAQPLLGENWGRLHRGTRALFERLGLRTLFLVPNFLLRLLLARCFETLQRPDVSAYDADLLVHPLAYARYHVALLRRIDPGWLLAPAALALGRRGRNLIVHLVRSEDEAAERITARDDPARAELHRDLSRLGAEFETALSAVRARGYEVVEVDASGRDPHALAREVERVLRERLG